MSGPVPDIALAVEELRRTKITRIQKIMQDVYDAMDAKPTRYNITKIQWKCKISLSMEELVELLHSSLVDFSLAEMLSQRHVC